MSEDEALAHPQPPDVPAQDVPAPPMRAADPDKRADRRVALTSIVATAFVGALGVIATMLATNLSVNAATDNLDKQISEERSKQDRENRAEAYFAFLDAADRYATAASNAQTCPESALDASQIAPECTKAISDLTSSRFEFQKARSEVYAYGSVEAEKKADWIAQYLPGSVGLDPRSIDRKSFSVKRSGFLASYQEFIKLACLELPTRHDDRPSCN